MEDFKARTLDYMENDVNANFMNMRNSPLPKRNNCDKVTNRQGKKLIELCQTFDLQILIRIRTKGIVYSRYGSSIR